MRRFLKRPLFWGSVASLAFSSWLIAGLAFGWTNPSANPQAVGHFLDEANNRTVCSQTFNVVYARCAKLQ